MSNLNELKRFEQDLNADKALQKKLDEICSRIAEEGRAKSDGEVMAAAAKELGYDVSVAALEQARAEAEQLDPAELEKVAGGGRRGRPGCPQNAGSLCSFSYRGSLWDEHDSWCFTAWYCYAATLHSDTDDEDVACWSDYSCLKLHYNPI